MRKLDIVSLLVTVALLGGCASQPLIPRRLSAYQDVVIQREKVIPIRGLEITKTRLGNPPKGSTDVVARIAMYGTYAAPGPNWTLTVNKKPIRVNARGMWAAPVRLMGRETLVDVVATGPNAAFEQETLRITLFAKERGTASR